MSSVVYKSQSIGGYDLDDLNDRAFAFDYDHSGKLDHLVLYRPGRGVFYVVKNDGGNFRAVYTSGTGVGGFDLQWRDDRAFAVDYEHRGKLDYLVLHRGETQPFALWIMNNNGGAFEKIYQHQDSWDLYGRSFAYDYESTGFLDHIIIYHRESIIIYKIY